MRLLHKTGAIFDRISTFTFVLACVLLAFMALSISYEVVMRYAFNRPTVWMSEINEYNLIWITFLSVAWVQKKGGHAEMDFLKVRLSPRGQLILDIIVSIVGGIIWLIIVWYSGQVTWGLFVEREYMFSPLEPLKAPIFVIIPLGSFLLFMELMRSAYLSLRSLTLLKEKIISEAVVDEI